ncbi:MAG: ADP-ribosylglycohydrolase family protein [Peptococcaceae bacterium]|nr:ADP-ribosylglycohydrolase family protein [Peptococcaceae bacterium]
MTIYERIVGGITGVAIGDALGVPVEFKIRRDLHDDPVTDMIGYGTYNQPPGTWSDDTSLTLCLAESLSEAGYNPDDIAKRFVKWYREGYMTPYGEAFDIGGTTRQAILRLEEGVDPVHAGPADERSNGNGSLMRILPAAMYFSESDESDMVKAVCSISRITHGHPRSQLACVFYSLLAKELLKGEDFMGAYGNVINRLPALAQCFNLAGELPHFSRILTGMLEGLAENDINSDGYVVSTLEAALWCLLKGTNFSETVLKAVNLGSDSDTTGAVAGGLAGIYYGLGSIPRKWLDVLAKVEDVMVLSNKLAAVILKD